MLKLLVLAVHNRLGCSSSLVENRKTQKQAASLVEWHRTALQAKLFVTALELLQCICSHWTVPLAFLQEQGTLNPKFASGPVIAVKAFLLLSLILIIDKILVAVLLL